MSETRTTVESFRIIIVCDKAAPRARRWHWTLEKKWSDRWQLENEGRAWTLTGARTKAQRGYPFSPIAPHRTEREEWIVAREETYTPTPRVSSPLEAKHV